LVRLTGDMRQTTQTGAYGGPDLWEDFGRGKMGGKLNVN